LCTPRLAQRQAVHPFPSNGTLERAEIRMDDHWGQRTKSAEYGSPGCLVDLDAGRKVCFIGEQLLIL